MRFTFKYSNDFGEVADACCRCGALTRERCDLEFPGVRLTVWACRSCLHQIATFFWFFHEFPLRAVYAARDAQEAGKAVAEYSNAFNFDWSGNGAPLTKNNKTKQARR